MTAVPGESILVVAAALIDADGRLLAARRSAPAALAGRWELPGGKVEPGEAPTSALRRECLEELGIIIELGEQVGANWPLGPRTLLRVWRATVTQGIPLPLQDHSELRWLAPGQWLSVTWLDCDMPVVLALQDA